MNPNLTGTKIDPIAATVDIELNDVMMSERDVGASSDGGKLLHLDFFKNFDPSDFDDSDLS
eukprot:CAMPEP_0197298888 /NCGR_PEP_ID=MMETSP0890-20130614/44711_1 /TAXON_ID=44058 ORGANISM="Aureoumbra lagunensis, Strain CCMP1510" /NCGR_SAMPLE_ID=MMETSP0890 /ASSEMBLY_ACC=CAM_ASM_000533 /LENGTH=60 /DNA_ID=CAMNT_0042776919 /DNA_START=113 /DNA_END=295 /DNA_ORIENTATION=-